MGGYSRQDNLWHRDLCKTQAHAPDDDHRDECILWQTEDDNNSQYTYR